jgi:glutamate-1-semialdehyde 2,1-aminomutase
MATILEHHMEKFRKSGELYERAQTVMTGGSPSSRPPRPFPIYMDKAQGGLKWDIDGNELVDYVMGSGALLLGHDHPKIVEALRERLGQGIHILANPISIRWAELITSMIPSAERVRLTGSGTESTYLALRLARAYTGKKKIVKFWEHFHGWHDYVVAQSGLNTEVGIPGEALATTIVMKPDIATLERLLRQDKDIAAVILEPTGGHWGQFPLPNPQFLHELRDVTTRHGVVMIMDEVITGFRLSRGGAQQKYDVLPDLTTLSKVTGGGLACGAVAGRADILDLMVSEDASRRVTNTGTFNGNPLAAVAGVASLELISSEPINERADANAERLKRGLTDALARTEVAGHVHGVSSIVHVVLGMECDCGSGVCTLPHDVIAQATAPERSSIVRMAMLNEGVDMMGGIGFMVSAVHTDEQLDRTVDAFERSLSSLRNEGVVQ